jgi:hypothetical protein
MSYSVQDEERKKEELALHSLPYMDNVMVDEEGHLT